MKKSYQKPTITVVKIQQHAFMSGSPMSGRVEPNLPPASRYDDDYYIY